MIKRLIIELLLFIVLFIGAALSFNYILNRGRGTRAVEGYNPTMGYTYIYFDGMCLNELQGFTETIDTSLYRDSVIPVDETKTVDIMMPDSVDTGAELEYALRSFDGTNLVEEGDFRFVETEGDLTRYRAELRMDLTPGIEYCLVIKAIKPSQTVYYYTRVVRLKNQKVTDFVNFAKDFSDTVYELNKEASAVASTTDAVTTYTVSAYGTDPTENVTKEKGVATSTDALISIQSEDLINYFGSADASSTAYSAAKSSKINSDGNPGYVTLSSSYEDVIFSGMSIERLSDPVPRIREVSSDSAIIEMQYKAISEENGNAATYAVTEYFSLEYDNGNATINVNDYRRYVSRDFSENGINPVSNAIFLGITYDKNPQYLSNESCKKISFVVNNSVWVYNNIDDTYASVYGTSTDEAEMERVPQRGYDIRLLSMDDDVIDFVVYGRMNEGPDEGKNGIALYEYTMETATLHEIEFISSELSLDALRLSVGRFTYYDKTNRKFHMMLGDSLVSVDVFSGARSEKVTNIPASEMLVSDDMHVVAYPDSRDLTDVNSITIIDYENGTEKTIRGSGKKLNLIGFVEKNILYGTAEADDISYKADGTPEFLFDALYIVDAKGNVIKEYERENILISGVRFDDNVIYLTRVSRNPDTGITEKADKDYITYKAEPENTTVRATSVENSAGNREVSLSLPYNVFVSTRNEELFTKVTARTNNREISFDDETIDKNAAYMFDPTGIVGVSYSVGSAVQQVANDGGFVVDGYGYTLYRRKISSPYLTVAGTFEYKSADTDEETFGACAYMSLLAAGATADYDEVRGKRNWTEIFNEYAVGARGINISGVSLDTAIGYLSDGSPFVARLSDRYVLVVSYNSDFIRYYDPIEGEEVRVQRYAFQVWCENQNNEFYTFIK